ncbi:TauD/TfdA family dioxygenase, partial [Streptomyces hayashii]
MIESKALSPALGVEFTGVTDPLDDSFVQRCAEALKWRGVLLVRGLHLDDERQLAFSRRLGEVVALNGAEIFPISINPEKSST